jgi:hypothetical protein
MNERENEKIPRMLKEAFAPVDSELRRDLWPVMLRKLDVPATATPWYDWALIGLSAGALALFPELILVFVYHL